MLEEFGPKIMWIKGAHDTVVDAISWLDYGPIEKHNHNWMTFTHRLIFYTHKTPVEHAEYEASMNFTFASTQGEESIYQLKVSKIAEAQQEDNNLKIIH